MDDDLTLTTASRETLEALNAILIADFDADDSGVVEHIVPGFDDDGETYDTDEF